LAPAPAACIVSTIATPFGENHIRRSPELSQTFALSNNGAKKNVNRSRSPDAFYRRGVEQLCQVLHLPGGPSQRMRGEPVEVDHMDPIPSMRALFWLGLRDVEVAQIEVFMKVFRECRTFVRRATSTVQPRFHVSKSRLLLRLAAIGIASFSGSMSANSSTAAALQRANRGHEFSASHYRGTCNPCAVAQRSRRFSCSAGDQPSTRPKLAASRPCHQEAG